MHFIIRYIAFVLGALMLVPLSVLSATDGNNRFAIFYGSLLILLFFICFFNPFHGDDKSMHDSNPPDTQDYHGDGSGRSIKMPSDPDMAMPMPEQPRANAARVHSDESDQTVIDFTRLRSENSEVSPQSDFSPEEKRAPEVKTANMSFRVPPSEKAREEKVSEEIPGSAVCDSESVDNLLLGALDRKIQITREERDGFLIQTTVITERRPLEMSKTSRVLRELGLSTSINDDDMYRETEFTGRGFTINDSQVTAGTAPEKKKRFHPVSYTFRMLKYILAVTILCAVVIFAIWLINDMHSKERIRDTFSQIIESIEPVKQQVEACINAEGPRFTNVCNDKHRSENYSWDLTDRFLSSHKDPNISAIRVDKGTITVYTNYDHALKGATYITAPTLTGSDKKTIKWNMKPESTCLKLKVCADTTGKELTSPQP